MAGVAHEVDIGDAGFLPPWSTVFEVIAATNVTQWILVGGLMVQLHAYRAGIPEPRITRDVDMVVDVAATSATVQQVAGQLQTIGFRGLVPNSKTSPAHRFARGEEQIDLMVAADLPSRMEPRLMQRPVFAVPAGNQALRRRDSFTVTSADQTFTFGAPDVLGAIIAKGAANRSDQRDGGRHLEDAALLLASVPAVRDLALDTLSAADRRHLVWVASRLPDTSPAWRILGDDDRLRGQRQLVRLVSAAGLHVQRQ